MRRYRLLALLTICSAVIAGPTAGQTAAVQRTLYFHSIAPAGTGEQAVGYFGSFLGGASGPTMDASEPLPGAPKVSEATGGVGNTTLRKNPFGAWWESSFAGLMTAPSVHFYAVSATSVKIDVTLFDNAPGPGGAIQTVSVPVVPGTVEYTASFSNLTTNLKGGLVVQMFATPLSAPTAGALSSEAEILYDSATTPSSVTFGYEPPSANQLPILDDPAGIAFNNGTATVANSGTGQILTVNAGFAVSSITESGLVPGGFARGPAGVAFDGDGNRYTALADSGEIEVVTPAGVKGIYARGLGVPLGIAFDASGNLWVADRAGRRLVKVAPSRAQTVAATFATGAWGVAVSPSGAIAVSQSSGVISLVDPTTLTVTTLTDLPGASDAEGIAYDQSGTLYAGDGATGRVVAVSPAGIVTDLATKIGGPLWLTFTPGTATLLVAAQSDDTIHPLTAGASGAPLAAPTGLGAALPISGRAWVHKSVAAESFTSTSIKTGAALSIDPETFTGPLPSSDSRYTGAAGVEPTIGVQSDGDLFMVESRNPCSIALNQLICGRTEVFRSRDQAQSWGEVTPDTDQGVETPPVSADPYIYVDRSTDRVFSVDLAAACNFVNYSDNDGQTWTKNPLGCGEPPVDHQTIVAFSPRVQTTSGYPNALVTCSNAVAASPCQRSLDGGDTWSRVGDAYYQGVSINNCGGALTSHLAADPGGVLYLPRIGATPCVSISADDGATWQVSKVTTMPGASGDHENRIAADSDGNLYHLFIGRDRLPYLSYSTNHAATWSTPKMVAPAGVTATNLPSIAAGGPGKVVLSYMGTTVDYGYGAPNMAKASWNGYLTTTVDALSADPTYSTTTANDMTDPIKRQACGPGRCDLVFDFLDVQIGPDGRAWATFGDMCTGACINDRGASTSFTTSYGFAAPLKTGANLLTGGALPALGGHGQKEPVGVARSSGVSARNGEVEAYGYTGAIAGGPDAVGTDPEMAEELLGGEFVSELRDWLDEQTQG